jgi:hypothetical protein
LGYKVFDMTNPSAPQEVADVVGLSTTLIGYVKDPTTQYPIAVSAYNAVGDGPLSATVIPGSPGPSVPERVTGITATIIPK